MERFEGGRKNPEIAAALRIGVRSVERWCRAWRELGETGVLSKGSPGRPGLVKPRWPGRLGSWSVAHLPTVGQTSGGRSHGSDR
ncbi:MULTISPECIES: helix-turn-helix domain-containing protein [unclassified Streptomyces]|uniref:helix-turn-helix domain-containing protein n=1 Tax=unclassified Streptomyces TaxID=2593676 RepID=UPI0033B6A84B